MTEKKNFMQIQLPAIPQNEFLWRNAIESFIAYGNPCPDVVADVRSAAAEVMDNVLYHAYKEERGDVFIKMELDSKDMFTLTVKDKGVGIPDVDRARSPLYTTGGDERSGMGFSIIESFMDKVRVVSTVGKGTTVTMTKQL